MICTHSSDDYTPGIPVSRRHRAELLHNVESPVHITEMDEDGKDRPEKGRYEVEDLVAPPGGVVV